MKGLLDTNILIDYLNGIEAARREIAAYSSPMISVITWMEVMIGAGREDEAAIRGFLSRFTLVPLSQQVAEITVELRRGRRLRLPDAIIWASARSEDALLVSRNSKDFPPDEPGVRMPYRV